MSRLPWKLLHDNPPARVRLYARRRVKTKTVRAISLQEIAIASGLPLARVQTISQCLNWEGITITEAERFVAGCGYDPLNPQDRNRQSAYDRSCQTRQKMTSFTYLKKSPFWATEFLPLIKRLKARKQS